MFPHSSDTGRVIDLGGKKAGEKFTTVLADAASNDFRLPKAAFYSGEGGMKYANGAHLNYQTIEEAKWVADTAPEIHHLVPHGARLTELGSGDSRKTEPFLRALDQRGIKCDWMAIDISDVALKEGFERIAGDLRSVRFNGGHGTFQDGIELVAQQIEPRIIIGMGSTIFLEMEKIRHLLRNEFETVLFGQDCHTDFSDPKVNGPFKKPGFLAFFESRLEVIFGPDWSRRVRYVSTWKTFHWGVRHCLDLIAKEDIPCGSRVLKEGMTMEGFHSDRFYPQFVIRELEAKNLLVHATQLAGGGSWIFRAWPNEHPILPPGIRVIKESDIAQIVMFMIEAFKTSPMFRFIRLLYEEYPHDAALSVEYELRKSVQQSDSICLGKVNDKDQCIAVILWRIHHFSPRTGQFRPKDIKDSEEGRRRDEDSQRRELFTQASKRAEEHLKTTKWRCEKWVTDPEHQEQGHGKELLDFSCALADMEGASLGVMPSLLGTPRYQSRSFKTVAEVEVDPQFKQPVMVRKAQS